MADIVMSSPVCQVSTRSTCTWHKHLPLHGSWYLETRQKVSYRYQQFIKNILEYRISLLGIVTIVSSPCPLYQQGLGEPKIMAKRRKRQKVSWIDVVLPWYNHYRVNGQVRQVRVESSIYQLEPEMLTSCVVDVINATMLVMDGI